MFLIGLLAFLGYKVMTIKICQHFNTIKLICLGSYILEIKNTIRVITWSVYLGRFIVSSARRLVENKLCKLNFIAKLSSDVQQ